MGDSHSSWFRGEKSQAAAPTGDRMGKLGKRPSLMTQELAHGYLSLTPQPTCSTRVLGTYSYWALSLDNAVGTGAVELNVLQA